MDIQKLKIGKRVAFTSRKTKGIGKIADITDSETGKWVTVTGHATHARDTVNRQDWYPVDRRAVDVTVRPSQVSAP